MSPRPSEISIRIWVRLVMSMLQSRYAIFAETLLFIIDLSLRSGCTT